MSDAIESRDTSNSIEHSGSRSDDLAKQNVRVDATVHDGEELSYDNEKEDAADYGYPEYQKNLELSSLEGSEVGEINNDDIAAILLKPEEDDMDMPSCTLRMIVISLVVSSVIAGVDSFFSLRFPTINIGAVVAQILAYPLGNLWYYVIPGFQVKLPFGLGFHTNPGKFNPKEHALIYMFSNMVVSTGLVNNMIVEQYKFFKRNTGVGWSILYNMCCYFISFSISGLCYDVLVSRAQSVWPGILSNIALFNTLHSRENHPVGSWTISRYGFFTVVFFASFAFYWLPDLLMPFLSTIGAWISWIRPHNATLSQVFGIKTGLGLFPLTFDWTQITSINNPLTTPFWSVGCIFISFVFWIWIIMPALYYQNKWQTGHFPIMTNSIFDVNNKPYNSTKVTDSNWHLDVEKFRKYSPVMLPVAFLMNLALGLATFSAMMIQFFLRFRSDVWEPIKNRNNHTDELAVYMKKYKRFHWSVFVVLLVIGLALGYAYCEGLPHSAIDAGGYTVSVVIGCCLFLPLALVESQSNIELQMDSFFDIISAFWYKGEPYTLFYFYNFGFMILQHAMHFSQSAKVAHYMRIDPRVTMVVLFAAGIWSSLVTPAVTVWVLNHVKGACTEKAKNNMICRRQKTKFNSQLVWGLFGNHLYGAGGRYSWVMYFFLVGAVITMLHYLFVLYKPNNKIAKKLNPVLLVGGASLIPSVTGYNYSTWFVFGLVFNYFIHRKRIDWWRKYNLVLAIGMDCGVAIAAIIIYFCVVYTGGSKHIQWWGSEVAKKGCDAKGCPHLTGKIKRPSNY